MASNFDPSGEDNITDINITPFVDVVLVLLVIFMVTAPIMVKESMNIQLPKAKSTDQSQNKTISVGISKTGQILLNGELIDLTLLYDKAVTVKKKFPEVQVVINADRESVHGDVIKVLDQIKLAGIKNFAFQVEKIVNE
ncbi:MAG: biopolymer transport protein ExbD [Bacteriovoracaceae bacterium]|jgi:biopolymer transport protein ExbD